MMRTNRVVFVLVGALIACGDDSATPDASVDLDTGSVDASVDVPVARDGAAPRDGSTPGDAGSLGRVLFSDDFESGNLDSWDEQGGEAGKYSITTDPLFVHAGDGALDITVRSDWSGGQLTKWFDAVDEVHVSMRVMFSSDWDQSGVSSRHFMQLSGNNVTVMRWGPYPDSSFGRSGETPDGTDFFWIHLTPWNDDAWHVGLAHPDQESQWGDSIQSTVFTSPGAYQHAVFHARLDSLEGADGFLRLYVDGALAIERTGLDWRTSDELVFNSVGFQAYYNDFSGSAHVYVDDLVVREGPPPGG